MVHIKLELKGTASAGTCCWASELDVFVVFFITSMADVIRCGQRTFVQNKALSIVRCHAIIDLR